MQSLLFFLKPEKLLLATFNSKKKNSISNVFEISLNNNEILNQNIFKPNHLCEQISKYIQTHNLKNCHASGALSYKFCLSLSALSQEYIFSHNKFDELKYIFHINPAFIFQIKILFSRCNLNLKNLTFDKLCQTYFKKNKTILLEEINPENDKDLLTIFGLYLMENQNERI